MATQSPLNWNQRKNKVPSLRFTSAEDYAKYHAALNSGATGMHEKGTIQSGPHKGKTPDQVYAYYLDEGASKGHQRRSPENAARLTLGLPEQNPGIDDGMTRTASNTNTRKSGTAPAQSVPTPTPPTLKPPAPPRRSSLPSHVSAKGSPAVQGSIMAVDALRSTSPAYAAAKTVPGNPRAIDTVSPTIEGSFMAVDALRSTSPTYAETHTVSETPPAPNSTPAQPNQPAVSAPQLEAQVRAQGLEMQNTGITQRGTDGSVLYNNGASISPTSPTGGRVLTSPQGSGSVTMGPATKKSFDGMSPAQFGAAAAARQGVGNRFTPTPPRLGQPAAPATPGPAQQRLADFTASNPPTLTDQQINQKQQTFQANRDKLTAIQAQKDSAAPRAPLNGMQIMTPEVARAAVAADKAQNPEPAAPSSPGRITTMNGRPYKSPLAADMGLPQPGQPSTPAPVQPATPAPAKPTGAFYAKNYVPGSLKPPMQIAGTRAAGGPVEGGQPYLVGEQGPEIVVPTQSGTVVPNHQVPSLRQPVQPAQPRKPLRPAATVVPIKPPSLLATFG